MPKRYDNNRILVFGDTHFPYEHPKTFQFLEDLRKDIKPDRVIHMGDINDIYSISNYPKDPDHPDSWHDEIKKARIKIRKLIHMFPKMEVLESNHDDRAYKKAVIAGVPREMLVPYSDILGAPEGWTWHRDLRLRSEKNKTHWYFAHTKTGTPLTVAKDLGCSVVLGHHHTKFGFETFKVSTRNIYGCYAGCLVSDTGHPFAYNKGTRGRPVQGAMAIIEGAPIMLPM